jgi:hypothetical protein
MGHSIHHKHYRYTEWRDKQNQTVSSVLTDLSVDPGEVTNIQNEPKYAEALALVRERLEERIKLAAYSSYRKEAPVGVPGPAGNSINRQSLLVDPSPQKLRQPIDGFGGSIAFWGTNPDDEAMKIAFQELKTTILRVQGEVSRKGITNKNREVLQRAMKLNPKLEVMLTFWQPRSAGLLEISDWLDVVEEESGKKYVLKPYMEAKWAEESEPSFTWTGASISKRSGYKTRPTIPRSEPKPVFGIPCGSSPFWRITSNPDWTKLV